VKPQLLNTYFKATIVDLPAASTYKVHHCEVDILHRTPFAKAGPDCLPSVTSCRERPLYFVSMNIVTTLIMALPIYPKGYLVRIPSTISTHAIQISMTNRSSGITHYFEEVEDSPCPITPVCYLPWIVQVVFGALGVTNATSQLYFFCLLPLSILSPTVCLAAVGGLKIWC